MTTNGDEARYSVRCKGCGTQFEFVDHGLRIEKTSGVSVEVLEGFDPEFPGEIRHGGCGSAFVYEPREVCKVTAIK